MPIRVRARPQPVRDISPVSARHDFDLPDIAPDDDFRKVVQKLSFYFKDSIELPSTFEQLRTTAAGNCLRVLVDHLVESCTNPAIVNALLALKWHYATDAENPGLGEARSNACEIVAWRFLTRLSERDAVNFCLYELPDIKEPAHETHIGDVDEEAGECSPLLGHGPLTGDDARLSNPVGGSLRKTQLLSSLSRLTMYSETGVLDGDADADPTSAFKTLNALEIAAVANAKRFLSQHIVQKIITGIWNGDIVFWDTLSINSTKLPRFYQPHTSDPFSRLRVPKYMKCWEVVFFAIFLCLYYSVLSLRDETHLTGTEIALFFWIAAFFYDELSEWLDAGSIFYATDVWNLFDMIMILIGFVFAGLRIYGIANHDQAMNDLAFDVLSLEALFMIPRICSILSLSPYWGTLIPCLKEMGKDFIKFMVLVVIIYFGFLTTFSLIGRKTFSVGHMTNVLTKIFFGSSYVGFDVMHEIDPVFGPPLMIIFITLSSILLTGSLTGILSNSFSRVITHAREEYLYVYSVYVLEASTSNRLTHFYPPFNLLAFVIFRPWRLMFASDDKIRAGRIILLKLTHFPIVAVIKLYEFIVQRTKVDEFAGFKGPKVANGRGQRPGINRARPTSGYDPHASATLLQGGNDGRRRSRSRRSGEDDVSAPSDVEVQINELSRKIDQLTSMVLMMQENQPGRPSQ